MRRFRGGQKQEEIEREQLNKSNAKFASQEQKNLDDKANESQQLAELRADAQDTEGPYGESKRDYKIRTRADEIIRKQLKEKIFEPVLPRETEQMYYGYQDDSALRARVRNILEQKMKQENQRILYKEDEISKQGGCMGLCPLAAIGNVGGSQVAGAVKKTKKAGVMIESKDYGYNRNFGGAPVAGAMKKAKKVKAKKYVETDYQKQLRRIRAEYPGITLKQIKDNGLYQK
jgi:hypothetical protein